MSDPNPGAAVLTREESARYLNISLRQFARLQDQLPAVRMGERLIRFRRADLDALVNRLAAESAAQGGHQ